MRYISDAELDRRGIKAGFRGILLQRWKKGFREGYHTQAQDSLLRILQIRFIQVPTQVQTQIKALTTEQLQEAIAPALQAESLTAFVQSLPQPSADVTPGVRISVKN